MKINITFAALILAMKKEDIPGSALNVQKGIEQPSIISPYLKICKKKRLILSPSEYIDGILSGNKVILSQAITLIESTHKDHFETAQDVLEKVLPYSGNSIRIGITGVPGVGKSTFIEAIGNHITSAGHKLAVLAIDPSSERSKGSILGDKTRMETLSTNPNAYIRPSATGLNLGGVARKTRETIILCEAAGYDVIFVETVGVGQSETVVKSMVDFFLLLMLSGAGDELQGIKRGIIEMADAIIITKADGDNLAKANVARGLYQSALHLFPLMDNGWNPPVDICSSNDQLNLDKVWNIITKFEQFTKNNGYFVKHRVEQHIKIFYEWIEDCIKNDFFASNNVNAKIKEMIPLIQNGNITPYQAGSLVINEYKNNNN